MQQEQDTLGLAFSVIAYLRCLFSEESFRDNKYNDLKLKELKNTTETRKMMEWIENINKSREKIHKVVLGIYRSTEKQEQLVEMYSVSTEKRPDFKQVCKALQSMKILKGRYVLKLKVYTTMFVEIKGFKRTDGVWDTKHLNEKELEGMRLYSEEFGEAETRFVGAVSTISCACTMNTAEKEMLLCVKCGQWTHASCHGYFSSRDKRIKSEFSCFSCLGLVNKEVKDCSIYRRVLSILYNEEVPKGDERINSTRTSKLAEQKNAVVGFLRTRLPLSATFTQQLLSQLRKDGFLSKFYELVKTREIKEKIKHYFNGRKMECLISINEISCDI